MKRLFTIVVLTQMLVAKQQLERDPFFLSTSKNTKKTISWHVVGLVQSRKKRGVVLQDGDSQRTLLVGDTFHGYTLRLITDTYIELVRKNNVKRVQIGL